MTIRTAHGPPATTLSRSGARLARAPWQQPPQMQADTSRRSRCGRPRPRRVSNPGAPNAPARAASRAPLRPTGRTKKSSSPGALVTHRGTTAGRPRVPRRGRRGGGSARRAGAARRTSSSLAAAARRVGAPVACPGQPPCAISHRVVSAFVLRGVHTACLSWATRAGRALRGILRGGLATKICPRHTRPVGPLIAPADALPRSQGPVGCVGRVRSDLGGAPRPGRSPAAPPA